MEPCPGCGQMSCICLKSTTPVFRNTHVPRPFGITRDEFGRTLYETVKCIGAIKQLQHYLSILLEDPPAFTIMRQREQEARQHLAQLLPQLSDAEDAEIRYRYPEVPAW